ncbi:MAG: post-COAP-1 domain-containing protein [Terriglobales bacterium]
MTYHSVLRLCLAACAATACAFAVPQLSAQTQIVLGDSAQEFQLQQAGNGSLQLVFSSCQAAQCVLSGSAFGDGSFASSNGSYALATSVSNRIMLSVTSDDSGSSFTVSQSQPITFQYTSSEGDLAGTLTLISLDEGNSSSTANLNGQIQITGGSLASGLSSMQGSVSLLVPLGAALSQVVEQGGSTNGQIGYPSTLSLAPPIMPSCPVCRDFVTGGGWILAADGTRADFGVHAGVREGGYWGHFEFNDHGSAPPLRVESTSITNYAVLSASTREIDGTANVNGQAGYSFQLVVSDEDSGGEGPGPNHADTFSLQVSNGYSASGDLGGGDIESHPGNCTQQLQQRGQRCQRYEKQECQLGGHGW